MTEQRQGADAGDAAARMRQHEIDQRRIDTFVVRARRIAAHSLAQDAALLHRLSQGGITGTLIGDRAVLRYEHPPEEQVESAAARVRPLIVTDMSLDTVLKAIKSLTADHADRESIRAWVAAVREQWRKRTGDVHDPESGFVAMRESKATGDTDETDSTQLARAWIYGDVVHHDVDRLERTRAWGVTERYRAAVPLVAYVMFEALNVLEAVRELEARGALTVSRAAWETDVLATVGGEVEAVVYVSEVGTPKPTTAGAPLGPEWSRLVASAPRGDDIDDDDDATPPGGQSRGK